jgi:hypothetical protein
VMRNCGQTSARLACNCVLYSIYLVNYLQVYVPKPEREKSREPRCRRKKKKRCSTTDPVVSTVGASWLPTRTPTSCNQAPRGTTTPFAEESTYCVG